MKIKRSFLGVLIFLLCFIPEVKSQVEEPYLEITSPTADTVWYVGDVVTVTWETNTEADTISFQVANYGVTPTDEFITYEDIPNDGEYSFTLPLETPTGNWFVVVSVLIDWAYNYISSPGFTITADEEWYLEITSPTADTVWYGGDFVTVTWETNTEADTISFQVANYGVTPTNEFITYEDIPNDGEYSFTLPLETTTGNWFVVVGVKIEWATHYYYSPEFIITTILPAVDYTIWIILGVGLGLIGIFGIMFYVRRQNRILKID